MKDSNSMENTERLLIPFFKKGINSKIVLVVFFLISVLYIPSSQFVSAASSSIREETFSQLGQAASAANFSRPQDPRVIAAKIIKGALGVLGTIFLVMTVYAGFLYMTSGGKEEDTGKAKKLLSNGVIGLVIILSALSITYFVSDLILKNPVDICAQNPTDPSCTQ